MVYGVRASVKELLQIPSGETSVDTEVDNRIADADAWIDEVAAKIGKTIPLAGGDLTGAITRASNYMAAYLWRVVRQQNPPPTMMDTAKMYLEWWRDNRGRVTVIGITPEDVGT